MSQKLTKRSEDYSQWYIDLVKRADRGLKIKFIEGDLSFSIDKEVAKKLSNELDFINKEFSSDIISGSIVLRLYGLIDRDINDIDIIINDSSRYSNYKIDGYGDVICSNRLGYLEFKYKSGFFSRTKDYLVDFFENKEASYDLVKIGKHTFKLHNPLEILHYKMEIGGACIGRWRSGVFSMYENTIYKHINDLSIIFNRLK